MADARELYEFGAFLLDVGERRVWSAGQIVPLAPKAHDVLVALVRRAGTLVTKSELLDLVWRDVSVEEGVLSVYISALRKSLGDSGGTAPHIETVPRAGYRFSATVRRRAVSAEPPSFDVADRRAAGNARSVRTDRSWPRLPDVRLTIGNPARGGGLPIRIALDPDYAAAHAGLAVAHCAEAELRLAAPDVAYTSARAALELNADHTEGWLLYGRLLEALGYLDEGLAAKQRVLERDPSSATVHLQIALSYWNQRRYDDRA